MFWKGRKMMKIKLFLLTISLALASAQSTVNTCQDISQPGNYVMGTNLTGNPNCLSIHDTSNVNLNCAGHSITIDAANASNGGALALTNVSNYSITNCVIQTNNDLSNPNLESVYVLNSSNGTYSGNAIAYGSVGIQGDYIAFVNNTSNVGVNIQGTHETVSNNIFNIINTRLFQSAINIINPPPQGQLSTGNLIENNTINGGAAGTDSPQLGADSAITVGNITNSIVRNNVGSNTFNCGIDLFATVTNSLFSGNSISNFAHGGYCAFYLDNISGNTFSNNTADNGPWLFAFAKLNQLAYGTQYAYFQDNVFNVNRFTNPRVVNTSPYGADIEMGNVRPDTPLSVFVLGNNVFSTMDMFSHNFFFHVSIPYAALIFSI